ncbi:MAG: hypothetical protein ABH806_03610 [Candidatus Omnitrophota bacterium]
MRWWDLADMPEVKYNDGYINIPKVAQEVGYHEWWLKAAGYDKDHISYKKTKNDHP